MQGKKRILTGLLAAAALMGASQLAVARDLVIGIIPSEDNEEVLKTFEPMRVYLTEKIGQPVKVFTATDYAGVIEAMKKKRVDIAWYGPLSYYLAEEEANAQAFAVGIRTGTTSHTYQSILLTACDSSLGSIADLKGKRAAFVDPASTSGGLMPSFMIKQQTGLMPQQYFGKFTYAGSHDAAVLAVKNKTVDVAATNDLTYERMLDKGLVTKQNTCVIATSPPMPGSPLAYRADLSDALKKQIQAAVLGMPAIEVAGFGKLSHFEAIAPADFQVVRDMVKELGLKKEQLK